MNLDRLEAALRRFAEIRPASGQPVQLGKKGDFDVWLDQDVCPVIEALLARPDFQKLARWSIDHLAVGCQTPERETLEAVDRALVAAAKSLVKLGRHPKIKKALRSGSIQPVAQIKGSNQTNELTTVTHEQAFPTFAVPVVGLAAIDTIAKRPWRDLVAVEDFFGPLAGLNLQHEFRDECPVQLGDFMPMLNPRLRRCGDFVVRMLLIRVEIHEATLHQFSTRCRTVICDNKIGAKTLLKEAEAAMHELVTCAAALRHAVRQTGPAKVQDASQTLVQTYAAYRPGERFEWLEKLEQLAPGACHLRYYVEKRDDTEIPELVAAALAEIQGVYRSKLDPEDVIQQKCEKHSLVLVSGVGRREAYWKGALFDAQWNRFPALWGFLLGLAEKLKAGQLGIDSFDLSETKGKAAKDQRGRLKHTIPTELDAAIAPAGNGTFKLQLQREEVCVLKFEQVDHLVEY